MSYKPQRFLDNLIANLYNAGQQLKGQANTQQANNILLNSDFTGISNYTTQNLSNPAAGSSNRFSSTPMHPQSHATAFAPPPPPGPVLTPSNETTRPSIIPADTLSLIPTRSISARAYFGVEAVLETRKGLSRILNAQSPEDIDNFGVQLAESNVAAIEGEWVTEDRLPIFALSYVQSRPTQGRFKFDDEQWQCFHVIVGKLAESGVTKFRVWLDQCLWLRDASQKSWAHTGILPYILWPVLCLGEKQYDGEKSVACDHRFWPFLEELSGLWGMGVVFGREMRSKDENSGWRHWMSYEHRFRLEPEHGLELILLNIFHGAVDDLHTGWEEDVLELKEMAQANVLIDCDEVFVGKNWRNRLFGSNRVQKSACQLLTSIALPVQHELLGGVNIYLDESRTVYSNGWNGIGEWLSGNGTVQLSQLDKRMLSMVAYRLKVMTDIGEFQMLMIGETLEKALWMLVAMDGRSSDYYGRGKVAWTKVMTGLTSCEMKQTTNHELIAHVLRAQLKLRVEVHSVSEESSEIEWE